VNGRLRVLFQRPRGDRNTIRGVANGPEKIKSEKEPDAAQAENPPPPIEVKDEPVISRDRPRVVTPKVSTQPLNFEEARELAQVALGHQRKFMEQKLQAFKDMFGQAGQHTASKTPAEEWYYKKVSFWMKRYENFVGLTEVKAAQARVVETERRFIETQEARREAQTKIGEVQKRIKEIHLELEKTHRGEDRYLVLVTQEHQVLKEELQLTEDFKAYEKAERENFSLLSSSVRDSHEKERAQAEKTKYWSVIGSVIGTCLGIFGTTINNRMRMNELRRLVSQNNSVEEIRELGPASRIFPRNFPNTTTFVKKHWLLSRIS